MPYPYAIRFRKRKGGKLYKWCRFAPDVETARKSAKKVIKQEFGDDSVLVSVKRVSKPF